MFVFIDSDSFLRGVKLIRGFGYKLLAPSLLNSSLKVIMKTDEGSESLQLVPYLIVNFLKLHEKLERVYSEIELLVHNFGFFFLCINARKNKSRSR